MIFRQITHDDLGCASYLVGDEDAGVAAVVSVSGAPAYAAFCDGAGLRDAQNNLTQPTILAPMSGRVTRLNVEEGETAIMGTMNKDAATLLTISDMSVLETRVRVDETDVASVTIGDSTVIQIDAFPDTTFLGRVVQISPRQAGVDPQRAQARAFGVAARLGHGDFEERRGPSGLTRGELLKRGAVGVAERREGARGRGCRRGGGRRRPRAGRAPSRGRPESCFRPEDARQGGGSEVREGR